MLKRFNRYPLIIDPSGQATEFIMNEYKDKKITKTRHVLLSRVLSDLSHALVNDPFSYFRSVSILFTHSSLHFQTSFTIPRWTVLQAEFSFQLF